MAVTTPSLSDRDKAFKAAVYEQPFIESTQRDFYEYWSEPDKKGNKMRFEMEKTWDLGRRMHRWQRIQDSRPDFMKKQVARVEKVMTKVPTNDYERLEALFTAYSLRPTGIQFSVFGEYFQYMKDENFLKELSQEEKDTLKLVYGINANKLRCAWVQKSLEHFAIVGFPKKKDNPLKKVI